MRLNFVRVALFGAVFLSALLCTLPKAYALSECSMRIGTNLWPEGWSGDSPRDANGWRQEFLDDLAPYACLRFMLVQGTNDAMDVTGWDNRLVWGGFTYERMIELCNLLEEDAWFCIPHAADDSFPRELAKLLKKQLKPGLKAYIEYSNETWNTASPFINQTHYCDVLAAENGLIPNTAEFAEPMGSQWVKKAVIGHAYRACQIFEIFKEVFGDEMSSRIVKVVGSQSSWSDLSRVMFESLQRPEVNPTGITVDALAIAPYFGHSSTGSDLGSAMDLALRAAGPETQSHLAFIDQYNTATGAKAVLVCYEGGQHYLSESSTFAQSPVAYDVYTAYLDELGKSVDLFCHFTHQSPWGGTAWGAKSYYGQPVEQAPKYRALVDWIQQHPVAVAVAPGTPGKLRNVVGNTIAPIPLVDLRGRPLSHGCIGSKSLVAVSTRGTILPMIEH